MTIFGSMTMTERRRSWHDTVLAVAPAVLRGILVGALTGLLLVGAAPPDAVRACLAVVAPAQSGW